MEYQIRLNKMYKSNKLINEYIKLIKYLMIKDYKRLNCIKVLLNNLYNKLYTLKDISIKDIKGKRHNSNNLNKLIKGGVINGE